MKAIRKKIVGLAIFCLMISAVNAQGQTEQYEGDVISFNGANVQTATFTLKIDKWTTDAQAMQNLAVLKSGGQDKLLSTVNKEKVGSFMFNINLSQTVNVARKTQVDGKTHIFAVFARWMQFAEIRNGYRSEDYPFSIVELVIDPATGKGDGTFIAAAQIRWEKDKKTNTSKLEIENFATYPAKLTNVKVTTKAM